MRLVNLLLPFKALGIVVGSWLLVHVMALTGVFIGAAYLIVWLFAPKKTTCFFCRARDKGEKCGVCKRIIGEAIHPKTISSALINAIVIFLFSVISVGIVYTENLIIDKTGFSLTQKTVEFVIPDEGQYRLGEIFPMKIEIIGIEKPINVVQADLGFNPNQVEVVSISTDESFANIFIQEEINNESGYIRLTGGLSNPGFFSNHGVFGTVLFRGKVPGLTKVRFLATSMILANDGKGTNVIKELAESSYLILPEKLSEKEEVLQSKLLAEKSQFLEESVEIREPQMKFYQGDSVLGAFTKSELEGVVKQEGEADQVLGVNEDKVSFVYWLDRLNEMILTGWKKIFTRKLEDEFKV